MRWHDQSPHSAVQETKAHPGMWLELSPNRTVPWGPPTRTSCFLGPFVCPPTDQVGQAQFRPPAAWVSQPPVQSQPRTWAGLQVAESWRAAWWQARVRAVAAGPAALGSGEDSPQTLQGALPPAKLAEGLDPRACCHPPKPPRGHLGTFSCWPRAHPEVLLPPERPPPPALDLDQLWGPGGRFSGVCSAHGDIGMTPAQAQPPPQTCRPACCHPPSTGGAVPRWHIAGVSERPKVTGPRGPAVACSGWGGRLRGCGPWNETGVGTRGGQGWEGRLRRRNADPTLQDWTPRSRSQGQQSRLTGGH